MFGNDDFLLIQDSAPSHTSLSTCAFLKSNNIRYVPKDKWPAKSCDLALMDSFVFGWMKREMRKMKFKTIDGLKRAIHKVWDRLPQQFIQNAFDKWGEDVQKMIDAKGGHFN